MITSLQVYCRVRWWKNFENRSTFGKAMGKSMIWCPVYLTHGVENHLDQRNSRHLIFSAM